jgi:TrmH family RNA methyltransferase
MVSKSEIKYIRSLALGKFRKKHHQFVAEGLKIVEEMVLTGGFKYKLFVSAGQLEKLPPTLARLDFEVVSDSKMKQMSQLTTPPGVLAIVDIPDYSFSLAELKAGLHVVLDGIRDPGNLGTIIRTAEWFGVQHVFISPDTVDPFHPKVVQATMGSVFRVQLHETELSSFLHQCQNDGFKVYGAVMDGANIYKTALKTDGTFLVIGSESHGISNALKTLIKNPVTIPSYTSGAIGTESLNASVAAAILLAEFRRLGA